ncbi:MAG: N-acetylglucosamine-6-phosphate deacetylase [Clostridia bacterium]|nr:N-acetylglucosamine-6-phosphate deacetylase [Clostridia bacterium]
MSDGRWTLFAGTVHTLAGGDLHDAVIVVEGGRIADIRAGGSTGGVHAGTPGGTGADRSYPNARVIPGLIDIHIHGGGGWDLLTGGMAAVRGLGRFLASRGTTAYRPTLGTTALDVMLEAARIIGEAMRRWDAEPDNRAEWGAQMLGIHLEGPFLNPVRKGAMPAEEMQAPSVELFERFVAASGGRVAHMTIAPELPGALELIRHAAGKGITVAGGHTDATYEQFEAGVDAGIRLGTHAYNAMRGLHHREPGALGAVLADDRVHAELIADGMHVHPAAMRLLLRAKGVDRVCLISDAVATAGLPPGEYKSIARRVIVDEQGFCRLPDGTLAGSTLNLMQGVRNAVERLGCSLNEALAMASRNPARLIGWGDRKGTLEAGKDADFVVVDDELRPLLTVVGGVVVYDAAQPKEDLLNGDI